MLQATLGNYAAEASDQTTDVADAWAEIWQARLECFLLPRGQASLNEDAILVSDTEVEEAEAAKIIQPKK